MDARLTTEIRAWTLRDLVDDEQFGRLCREAETGLSRFVQNDGTIAFPAPALVAVASH
ncbi:MAG: hypothetical protein ABJA74_04055 [Lapillicoccus sp.]